MPVWAGLPGHRCRRAWAVRHRDHLVSRRPPCPTVRRCRAEWTLSTAAPTLRRTRTAWLEEIEGRRRSNGQRPRMPVRSRCSRPTPLCADAGRGARYPHVAVADPDRRDPRRPGRTTSGGTRGTCAGLWRRADVARLSERLAALGDADRLRPAGGTSPRTGSPATSCASRPSSGIA